MTNSMIPFSFIPGTKAKASEVNANFIALTELINAIKDATNIDFEKVYENLALKANKSELINEFLINETDTNLNNYQTKGTYIFTNQYLPLNSPKESAGTLFVTKVDSLIKQIWHCEDSNEFFGREFSNNEWQKWESFSGTIHKSNPGYIILPNNLIIQWGSSGSSTITFPIAFPNNCFSIFCKVGYGASYERSDSGIIEESLTGFTIGTGGVLYGLKWISIGY